MDLNLTRNDQEKIVAIMAGMTFGIPIMAILFSIVGLIDLPITSSFLRFSAGMGFVYSLLMIVVYVGVKDKLP